MDIRNLVADKDGYLYDYDGENRIVRISRGDGDSIPTTVAEFVYDALNRRIYAYDAIAGAGRYFCYNNGWQVIARIFPGSFGFGRPFCPAAAFSVQKVLSVFSNTPPVLLNLRPCGGPIFLAQNGLNGDEDILGCVRDGGKSMPTISTKPREIIGLEEYNTAGSLAWANVFGNTIDEVLVRSATSSKYYFVHNHLYSPVAVMVEEIDGSVFGLCSVDF